MKLIPAALPKDILRQPAWWFSAACAVLGFVLIAEWLPADAPPPPVRPLAAPKPAPEATGADATDANADKDVDSWADTIVARPLFSAGRRPPKSKGSSGPVASAGMPRLSGIIVTRASRRAIFMPDGGKPLVLAEGASIDDATIRRIAPDRVFISGPKGDQVMYPSFDHNRVAPAPILPANMFPPNPPGGFHPGFPNAAQVVQPQPDNSDDNNDNNDNNDSQPQTAPVRPMIPMPPVPGGFHNPMFPRGRPQ